MLKKLSAYEKGWLAALIDGEGCIYNRREKKHYGQERIGYISISNTSFELMEHGAKILGTKVRLARKGKIEPKRKAVYCVEICHKKKLILLLPQLIPYLIIKKDKAMELLEEAKKRGDYGCPPCWCGEKHYAKGLCYKHYDERRKKELNKTCLALTGKTFGQLWYEKNRTSHLERCKEYYLNNREEILARDRDRYQAKQAR